MNRNRVANWFGLVLMVAGFLTSSVHAANSYLVTFRLPTWKAAHFDEAADAKAFGDQLTKLGCEVRQGDHGGHIDVSYRCSQWKSLRTASDDAAHTWERWLRRQGFEVEHKH